MHYLYNGFGAEYATESAKKNEFEMRRYKKIVWSVVVVAVAAIATVAVMYRDFYGSCVSEPYTLYIYDTTSYATLRADLEQHIVHKRAFDIYARRINLAGTFKHGRYELREGMSVMRVARMLKFGEQLPVRFVISHARTAEQLAGRMAAQIEADSAAVLAAMYDRQLREELGFGRDSIMAMFIPNTYEIYWTTSPDRLLRRLKREYDRFWQGRRDEALSRTGLSRTEAMTLASIVYEETKQRDEMPKIAGVYINRLHRGMALQACPTVKFAMRRFDLHRVLNEHLRYDSPYNTYRHRGLPPGPICIPSIVAIDAVLGYEKSDYLFFCARPEFDGRHNFARTLGEHATNSRRYSAELKRRNIK